jgi:hypothetical protein
MHSIKRNNKWCCFLLILLATFASCKSRDHNIPVALSGKQKVADSLFKLYGPKIGILSCLRCDCFRNTLNKHYSETGKSPVDFILMTDTNCTKLNFPVVHLPDSIAAHISDDFYNIVLLKKQQDSVVYKILTVDESPQLNKIADLFFKNDRR